MDSSSGGIVVIATGTPKAAVTGPGAAVKIYNPIGTTTDYSGNFTLTDATLTQYYWLYTLGLTGATGATGPAGAMGLTARQAQRVQQDQQAH